MYMTTLITLISSAGSSEGHLASQKEWSSQNWVPGAADWPTQGSTTAPQLQQLEYTILESEPPRMLASELPVKLFWFK